MRTCEIWVPSLPLKEICWVTLNTLGDLVSAPQFLSQNGEVCSDISTIKILNIACIFLW